jgi:hypothetical protein
MKLKFAGIFLTAFAILTAIWWLIDFGELYRTAVLFGAQLVSPVLHGWFLEFDVPGLEGAAAFKRGAESLPMVLQLPQLAMGVLPLTSLIVATPGQTWPRAAMAAVAGCLLYYLVDVIVVAIYPMFMDQRMGGAPQTFVNVIKDTVGVFSGLVAFVVAPLAIWFVLTYRALQSVWQLTPTGEQSKKRPPTAGR